MAHTMPPTAVAGSRYVQIDGLRAFAVLPVVLLHAGVAWSPGDAGVTIFFVISGFVIANLLIRERERTEQFKVGAFYARRGIKLLPPLLVFVLIPTVIYAMFAPIDWGRVLGQVFFVYNWVEAAVGTEGVLPTSTVVWSLAIEEQFYLVFAVLWILLMRSSRWRHWLVVLCVVAIVWSTASRVVLTAVGAEHARLYHGTDVRLDAIAMGTLVALAFSAHRQGGAAWVRTLGRGWVAAAAIALFVAAALVPAPWFKSTALYSVHGLAIAVLILAVLVARPGDRLARGVGAVFGNRLVVAIGLASYSIYLSHLFVVAGLSRVFPDRPPFVFELLTVIMSVGVGWLGYRFVEVPAQRLRRFVPTSSATSRTSPAPEGAPEAR